MHNEVKLWLVLPSWEGIRSDMLGSSRIDHIMSFRPSLRAVRMLPGGLGMGRGLARVISNIVDQHVILGNISGFGNCATSRDFHPRFVSRRRRPSLVRRREHKTATPCISLISSGLLAHPSSLGCLAIAATRSRRVPFPEREPLTRASRQSSIRKISEADSPPLLIQTRILHALLYLGLSRQGEQIISSPLTPVDPILQANVTLKSCCERAGHIMVVSRLALLGVRLLKEPRLAHKANGVGTLWIGHKLIDQSYMSRNFFTDGPFSHYGHALGKLCFSSAASGTVGEGDNETEEKITVTFVDKDGDEKVIKVPVGMSMLEAAHENDIELEGACEGSLACSTCHVIVMDVNYYNKLEDPTDEENDMLDLAFGLTETSRLGCQIVAKPELDGIRLALPVATRNFAVDGYVPKPH